MTVRWVAPTWLLGLIMAAVIAVALVAWRFGCSRAHERATRGVTAAFVDRVDSIPLRCDTCDVDRVLRELGTLVEVDCFDDIPMGCEAWQCDVRFNSGRVVYVEYYPREKGAQVTLVDLTGSGKR